jgi:hypothetical protein
MPVNISGLPVKKSTCREAGAMRIITNH